MSTMLVAEARPSVQPDPGDNADDVNHIVSGWWQRLLDKLELKVPKSLCGVRLQDVDGATDDPDAPLCPRCAEIDGRRPDDFAGLVWVPAHGHR